MSTSTKNVKKVAIETAPPAEKTTVARSTTSQRTTRSLREKVLAKTVSRKASDDQKPEVLEEKVQVVTKRHDSDDDSTAAPDTIRAETNKSEGSVEERTAAWAQSEIPPRPIDSDDESFPGSVTSDTPSVTGRPSYILVSSKRRTGVEMDLANKLANEMLQNGKEALEQAGNMKKECKTIALDSLQTLYETVLAISDSRSRHKYNLEKERTRHAQELVRVERAHNKQLVELKKGLTEKLNSASRDIESNLKESKTIKDWLGYETRKPHAQIAEIGQTVVRLERTMKELSERVSSVAGNKASGTEQALIAEQKKLSQSLDSISRQIDALRRDTTELSSNSTQAQMTSARVVELLESCPQATSTPESHNDQLQKDMCDLKAIAKEMRGDIKKIQDIPPAVIPTVAQTAELAEHLHPITERLEAVSSELRTMREQRQRTPPPARSLGDELAHLEEAKAKRRPNVQTYAQVAATTPTPRPNHTLIVSSTDPNQTGENVIETIRKVLDSQQTGARVDRVRKARNQKVVLSCGTSEDMALLKSQVGTNKGLKVEVAKTTNPLIIIKDVLAYHKDEEIIAQLRAKNKEIFVGLEKKDDLLRVRYRKKARNVLECHPVLELSPVLYKKFIEAGVAYIGLQRRPVQDQSPLVQCARCLGYGHTKAVCREEADLCSFCGGTHSWEKCSRRQEGSSPSCKNCIRAQNMSTSQVHAAYSRDCPERQKWDAIARSRISYC